MLPAFGPLPGTTAWFTYHRTIEAFSRSYSCVLVDYPNFGRTSPLVFHEPVHDVYVRLALAVLDDLGVERMRVLGVSTGGTVALDLALTAPERVTALVVGACEASTGGDPYLLSSFPSEGVRLFDEHLVEPPDRARIERLVTGFVYDPASIDPAVVDQLYEWRLRDSRAVDSWKRSRSVPHSNIGSLRQIAVDTLIVHGSHDRMVPVEQALRLRSLLPAADLVVLGDCGHWLTIDRPDAYTRVVLSFLDQSSAPVRTK
ncbi:MAG: alpha/beta fold hydrolase [Acidimicrobiia bacterium]